MQDNYSLIASNCRINGVNKSSKKQIINKPGFAVFESSLLRSFAETENEIKFLLSRVTCGLAVQRRRRSFCLNTALKNSAKYASNIIRLKTPINVNKNSYK